MSPRTGRPKVDNPINKRFSVCLDAQTLKLLEDYCKKHGITKGEAMRKGIQMLLAKEK